MFMLSTFLSEQYENVNIDLYDLVYLVNGILTLIPLIVFSDTKLSLPEAYIHIDTHSTGVMLITHMARKEYI